jgi:hypothetical protein
VQLCGRLPNRLSGVIDQRTTGRVRILVGVQPHRDLQLRCTIGGFAAQVIPQRQIVETYLLT